MDSFLICSAYKQQPKEAINDNESKFIEIFFYSDAFREVFINVPGTLHLKLWG
jgi:hypothetical protein